MKFHIKVSIALNTCALFLSWHLVKGDGNEFSSFLSSNASLAVVVDQKYTMRNEPNILSHFRKILSDNIREHLKNGGVNVRYFTWVPLRLKKEFIAAISITDCENTWNLFESSLVTSVLLIAITDSNCPRLPSNRALMLPVVGNENEFEQMILDTKSQSILDWKSAILLIDQSMVYKNSLLIKTLVQDNSKHYMKPLSLYLYKLNDSFSTRTQKIRVTIREILEPFSRDVRAPNQFIVMTAFYEDIIEMAAVLNMFHIYNQWLFFINNYNNDNDSHGFNAKLVTQNLQEGANIAFVKNATKFDCVNTLNCTLSEVSFAFITSLSRMIDEEQSIYGEISDEEWESIRLTKQEKQNEILHYMTDYLKENSKCSSCSSWQLETALTWGKSQEHKMKIMDDTRNKYFEFIDVGSWRNLVGFNVKEYLFPHTNQYFRNITLDIITMHNPPWQIISKNNRNQIVAHTGIVMEILKELSHMLNFTYNLHAIEINKTDDVIGFNESNELLGSLTYIIPQYLVETIQENRFLLAAMAVTIDEIEFKPFNYTVPISIQKYTFMSRKPDEVSRIYLFTAPFTLETWASLIGIIFIIAPILYGLNCLVPVSHLKTRGLCSIKYCFWYIYGALLQQGGTQLPKSDSGRILVGFWLIVAIVLVTTYCGNLVAFLTFPKFQPGLEYLSQVFRQREVEKYALRNGTFFQKYSTISTRPAIRHYVEIGSVYSNIDHEDITAVENGERIIIDWRINLQLLIQRNFEKYKVCKFMLGKEDFVDEPIGLVLPSNSPYLHLINDKIIRLFQTGFIERWHKNHLPVEDKCTSKSLLRKTINHTVNLVDMQGCFLVLLIGSLIALLLIFLEYGYHRWYELKKKDIQTVFSN